MDKWVRVTLLVSLTATLLMTTVPVEATPVCAEEPRTVCGGRIFPEAENTTAFVQHDMGEYEDGIKALAREFPRFVKVTSFSDFLGRKTVSAGDREMWLVEITDFDVPEKDKVPVVVSLSVHGPERAGLEGGVRYMEDLARWAAEDRDHVLKNGTDKDSIEVPVLEALANVHLYLASINPDGWSRGDVQNGGVFMRGNANGVDLNREFPTVGWTRPAYTPLSEPESIAWHEVVHKIDPLVTADLHGELTSAQDAFADMMLPAGQWDPLKQAREEALARHMKSNVERYFEETGVEAAQASGVAGMKPAEYATGYDVVGYDASGFMGDWFNQDFPQAIDMDVEHFFSHMVPNSEWAAPIEEAHIEAVRAEIETFVVEAMVTNDIRVKLNVGKVGYLNDPRKVTDADGYGGPKPAEDYDPESYNSSRMRYFRDMSKYTTKPIRKVPAKAVAGKGLRGLGSFVIADKIKSKALRSKRTVKALKRFVRRGGNLVLTDAALKLLPRLGTVGKKAVGKQIFGAGHLNIDGWDDPFLKGVHHTASQTYYEVGLGFSVDEDSSPHWTVSKSAWDKAKGVSIAHIEDEERIGLGRVNLGRGTVSIIGALLPTATEKFDHYYGLADYAVSVAGGQIFNNMLRYGLKK